MARLKSNLESVNSSVFSADGERIVTSSTDHSVHIWRRTRPEWWWGVFYMLEFWFSVVFASALVVSLIYDRRAFARMDCEAARARENRSRPERA